MPSFLSDLSRTAPPDLARPGYDRRAVRTGIVHLGLGAFHRAHQALYTEAALARGDTRWGIAGVELRRRHTVDLLARQDHLYTVTKRYGETVHTRLVGAVHRALFAPESLSQLLQLIADPSVSIVSLTVTEKGYYRSPGGGLDTCAPEIAQDLATPDTPRTALGVIAAGLRLRPANAALTVLSCDNMPSNGEILRALLIDYAERIDQGLARRIRDEVAFPNSMVDRIVPAATPESLDWVQGRLNVRDPAAIVCEPFSQWVIEDRFAGPRPRWEDGGALIANDVGPYERMKLRLLNGSHSAIAYAGQLRARPTVSDAMADPLIAAFVEGLMTQDLLDTVAVPRDYDARGYCATLMQRFRNPSLAHRTEQIAMDGTQKVPLRWLPALSESTAARIERPYLERALALWLHYLETARDEAGRALTIIDPGAAAMKAAIGAARNPIDAVRAAFASPSFAGTGIWPDELIGRIGAHLSVLRERGTAGLLEPHYVP